MKRSWPVYLTIVCTLFGLLLSWQYKSIKIEEETNTSILQNSIIEMIEDLEVKIASVEEEIDILRDELAKYQKNDGNDIGTLKSLQDSLQRQRSLTSLTSESGTGLIITLDDNVQGAAAASTDFASFKPEDYIIHDKTLLYLLNELKAAGATAISINNQRIISSSDIRCVGTVILVNTIPMAPPYQVKALGNPEDIKEALLLGDEIPYLRARSFPVKFEIADVEIPGYKSSLRTSHLQKGEE